MFKEALKKIVDNESGKPAECLEFILGISKNSILEDYKNKWIVGILELEEKQGKKFKYIQDWGKIVSDGNRNPDVELYRLEFKGELQAMMAISISGSPYPQYSYPEKGKRSNLVYVRHLELAPWNKHLYEKLEMGNRKLRNGGIAMLNCARILSEDLGKGGRIGLHALKQAVPFYKKLCDRNPGFNRIASDNPNVGYQNYFEFDLVQNNGFEIS